MSAGSQPFAITGRRRRKAGIVMARVVGRCWSLVALSVLRLTAVPHKAATAHMLACGIRASTSEPAHETVVICLGEMVPDATVECRELSAS